MCRRFDSGSAHFQSLWLHVARHGGKIAFGNSKRIGVRFKLFMFCCALAGLVALLSGAEASAPAGPDEVPGLIAKLADPNFRVRSEASARLREIGAAALPALHQAIQGTDPEVRARAGEIVHVLEHQPVPGRSLHRGYARQRKITTHIIDGRRSIDVDDKGRTINIVEDDDGIKMTVSGETNGKAVTRTYTARTAEQLRLDDPEAFAVYQRFAQAGGFGDDPNGVPGNVIVQQGNVIVFQRFQPAAILIPQGADDLAGLRDRTDREMDKLKLPPLQRARVRAAIDRVEQTQDFNPVAAPIEQEDERVNEYDKACDDLRKALANSGLPDPGDALPPPKSSRLGVNVQQEPLTGAITVRHVLPHSRADRIGLQDDDLVHKINGQEVHDVKDLRRLVSTNPNSLTVDVTRDGREMQLEEPK
jgi:hypothetical protein